MKFFIAIKNLRILFISAFFVFFSCEKNNLEKSNINEDKIFDFELEQGIISINSMKEFIELNSMTGVPSNYLLWKERNKFFSLKDKIDQIYLENKTQLNNLSELKKYFFVSNENRSIEINFPFYDIAYLLNEEGVIRVGKKLFRFTNEYVYSFEDKDLEKIRDTYNLTDHDKANGIYVSKIIQKGLENYNSNKLKLRANNTIGTCTEDSGNLTLMNRIITNAFTFEENGETKYFYNVRSWVTKTQGSFAFGGGSATISGEFEMWITGSPWLFDGVTVNSTLNQATNPYVGLWSFGIWTWIENYELENLEAESEDFFSSGTFPNEVTISCTLDAFGYFILN